MTGVARPSWPRPVVEFVGIAGAGKSTVADGVVQSLAAAGIAVADRTDVLSAYRSTPVLARAVSQLPLGHRRWALFFAATAFARGTGVGHKEALRRAGKLTSLVREVATGAGGERARTLVLDQGPLQSAASMIIDAGGPSLPELRDLLAAIYAHACVTLAYCEVDAETAWARIRKRETSLSRFDRASERGALGRLEKHAADVAILVQEAARLGLPVIALDGRVDAESNAEHVAAHVLAWIDGPVGQDRAGPGVATTATEES